VTDAERIAELEERVAWLQSELGLTRELDDVESLQAPLA
jgi:uncharacterized small protein (DUF1192 family)